MVTVRAYDPTTDTAALWSLKSAFETELGDTGADDKATRYRDKLTTAYRERYLDWVVDCVDTNPDCIQVAADADTLVGYVFVLPESLAYIWDGAVLNELFVETDYRGTGVADELLDAALAVATAQDLPLDRILLDVDPENDRARRFYDRHGFAPWGELLARDL